MVKFNINYIYQIPAFLPFVKKDNSNANVSYQYLLSKKKKSTVNKAGNYTKPGMRKKIFQRIKAQASHGTAAGQWSARKAQALAKAYKKAGGGYK